SRATPRRSFRRDLGALSRAVAVSFALGSADAAAQVSGSLSVVSNYRYRGVTLSHNDPAAQATLVYDDPQGWYAGAFASSARIGNPASNQAQGIFFAGYAWTASFGASFEAGAVYTGFTGPSSYAYPEVVVGATYDRISARLHYSPNYYGRGSGAVYGEVDGTLRLHDHVQAVAHVGVLWTDAQDYYGNSVDTVLDGRVGLVFDFTQLNVQLSWVGINESSFGYGLTGVRSRNGPVLSLSWLF
ncbi:MAG TPA: TorF family putative porin, partial [Casimicrobiaceae bacterium]|nr:TorF family putative porin [Casimicrobiaceae bacterium]